MSAHLYNLADELKQAIVVEADGKDGDVRNIRNKEDLEAANQVMLAPGRGRGKELFDAINAYRVNMLKMVTTPRQKKLLISTLTTEIRCRDSPEPRPETCQGEQDFPWPPATAR